MPIRFPRRLIALCVGLLSVSASHQAYAQKCEFPGFRVDLLYSHPEVIYPTVVTCDGAGNLFVGEDPMDMTGPSTQEIDRIQYITFNTDGSVKRKTVFAENLSAVFGLIWHEDALYVLHAPHYTMFKDTNGDGVADVRKDLADGFGPPAGIYGFNDHIVTGTRLGMDGRVYISVGDKGVPLATGSDGSTISLEGGGVVRMQLDGTELEIYSAGTRNHLDVAMDSQDNVFTYDNTDDGLGWWTRYTHHIETGYYGYPYDYHPHPDRHLPRIAEYGGGSPVGAACYRDDNWPEEFRDAVLYCEWGKRKVQLFKNTPSGATFTTEQKDFLVPEAGSEFRPQDLCFSPDGKHMYVADWNFDGWTQKKESGRLYRVTYVGEGANQNSIPPAATAPLADQLKALSSPSFDTRFAAQWWFVKQGQAGIAPLQKLLSDRGSFPFARIHAIWGLNGISEAVTGFDPLPQWIEALQDSDPRVRAQAARAIGLRQATTVWGTYNVAEQSRRKLPAKDLAPPSSAVVKALIAALKDQDATVRLRVVVALGRIGDVAAAAELFQTLGDKDDFVRFAAVQAIRAINDWKPAEAAVASDDVRLASGAVLAMTHIYDTAAVQGLASAIEKSKLPEVQAQAIASLGEVYRKADPYLKGWWGTRPAMSPPKRAHIHDWEGSFAVETALQQGLAHSMAAVRLNAIRAVGAIKLQGLTEVVRKLAVSDPEDSVRLAALQVLGEIKDPGVIPTLVDIAKNTSTSAAVRVQAVDSIAAIGSASAIETLVALIRDDQTAVPLMQRSLAAIKTLGAKSAASDVAFRLNHADPGVRAEAIRTLGALQDPSAADLIIPRLQDENPGVRSAAMQTLASLHAQSAVPEMIKLAADKNLYHDAVISLAILTDRRALNIYLAGLVDKSPEIREACRNAVLALRKDIKSDLQELHQRNELTPEIRRELGELLASPKPILRWDLLGEWPHEGEQPKFDFSKAPDLKATVRSGDFVMNWQVVETKDPDGRFHPDRYVKSKSNVWVVAYTSIEAAKPTKVTYALGSDDQAILYVNGEKIYEYLSNRGWKANQTVGTFMLRPGMNHIWFQCGNNGGPWDFSLAVGGPDPELAFLYEDIPPALDLAAFRKQALGGKGNPEHGKALFFDPKGIGCVKCHSIGDEGTAKVGPNLQGVGTRYPREELIRSVLEPSNRIFSGYEMTVLATDDGKIYQGIIKNENDDVIELVDTKGETITLPAKSIEDRKKSNLSAMPNGLEKGMSLSDFADIISYLESVKGTPQQP